MSVTYYVALPFVKTEDGVAAGQAEEVPNETGSDSVQRSGDPNLGTFNGATILRSFGTVADNLDEL